MIIELAAYTMTISVLMGLAAWMVERAFSATVWPRRWLWIIAMTISLGGSAVMALGAHPRAPNQSTVPLLVSTVPAAQLPASSAISTVPNPRDNRGFDIALITEALEAPVRWVWLGASLLLLGVYVSGGVRLRHAKRSWKPRLIDGYNVWVTENVGPAVVGFRHPLIVLPRWLLDAPSDTRDVALAHEHEHIAAHDSRLLLAALLLLVLTPWNLPLWWQLRRLKLAIEVDCDRRVLRRGVDRKYYAYTLLGINQRSVRMPMAAIAIVRRTSQIERRISTMVAQRPKHLRLWVAGWAAAAIPLLVVAADIRPPSPPATLVDSNAPHALLGIGIAEFDVNGAARAVATHHTGVLVTYVHPGSAADLAGLKKGDVILKFGHTSISGMTDLLTQIGHTAPDASMSLTIRRGPEQKASVLIVHFSPILPLPSQQPNKVIDASDWDSLRDESLPIKDPQLRTELIQMSGLDRLEAMQSSMSKLPAPPPNTSVVSSTPWSASTGSDSNVRRLKAILAESGWPTVSMVGVRGARAAALIAIASRDPGFKAEALALMEPLMLRDEVPANEYAMLYDIVHTPQRFGTELDCQDGVMKPSKPVEDPIHLDARRTALGLNKLPEHCQSALPATGSTRVHPSTQALAEEPVKTSTPGLLTYNFKDADIRDIARAVNRITHKTLVIDPRVHARMTISSPNPVSPAEFYETFKAMLKQHGFIAVPDGDATKILPDEGGANSASKAKSATSVLAAVSAGTPRQVNLPLAWKVQDGLFFLDNEAKLQFSADTVTEMKPGTLVLEGHVRITGHGSTVASDRAVITHNAEGGIKGIIVGMAKGAVLQP